MNTSLFLRRVGASLRQLHGPEAERSLAEYQRLTAEAYEMMSDLRPFSADRIALKQALRWSFLAFLQVRAKTAPVAYHKGEVVEYGDMIGTIKAITPTELGVFYQLETGDHETVEIFGGLSEAEDAHGRNDS